MCRNGASIESRGRQGGYEGGSEGGSRGGSGVGSMLVLATWRREWLEAFRAAVRQESEVLLWDFFRGRHLTGF